MSDWQTRDGVEQWMLSNLNTCLRAVRRHEEGGRITAAGLGLAADSTEVTLRLWRALDAGAAGAAGDIDNARETLDWCAQRKLSDYQAFLRDLVAAVAAHADGGFAAARRALATVAGSSPAFVKRANLLSAYRLALRAIARRAGVLGRLWRLCKYLGTVSIEVG
jgi:hypothetical protein